MDFNSHTIDMPLHTYESCLSLWKRLNEASRNNNGYAGIIRFFRIKCDNIEQIDRVVGEFDDFCMGVRNGRWGRTNLFFNDDADFILDKIFSDNFPDLDSNTNIVEYLDSHPVDYFDLIKNGLTDTLSEFHVQKDIYDSIFNCVVAQIEMKSMFSVHIGYADYLEFKSMSSRIETNITNCQYLIKQMDDCDVKIRDMINLCMKKTFVAMFMAYSQETGCWRIR